MADPYIGQINLFGGNFAPRGYALCQGGLLQIAQHTALFSIIGTIYGGDGRVTFGLPNLQSRAPMFWGHGPGLTPRTIGEVGGAETVTLNEAENAPHSHPMQAGTAPSSNTPAQNLGIGNASLFAAPSSPELVMNSLAVDSAGSGVAHSNVQPFLAVSFIIALEGVYPPRS